MRPESALDADLLYEFQREPASPALEPLAILSCWAVRFAIAIGTCVFMQLDPESNDAVGALAFLVAFDAMVNLYPFCLQRFHLAALSGRPPP